MARVVSCRYLRWSCSEDDHPLFRRHYTRSNRDRGVKFLRCFPHCCPEHVHRGYCGSSIHVQVTFAAAVSAATLSSLAVLARFEPSKIAPANSTDAPGFADGASDERGLAPGEVVALPASLMDPMVEVKGPAAWVRAVREGDKKQQALSKDSVLYVLNNHRHPRWLYNYESSISKARREMTHHLVVYVFQIVGSVRPGIARAAVLARHESPAFTFVSYRRSGKSALDAGCDLPALDIPSQNTTAAMGAENCRTSTWNGSELAESANQGSHEAQEECCGVAGDHVWASQLLYAATGESYAEGDDDTVAASSSDWSASPWWFNAFVRQLGVVEKSTHLLVLWRFLSCMPLSGAGSLSITTLDDQVRSHWWRAKSAASSSPDVSAVQLRGVLSSFLIDLCAFSSRVDREKATTRKEKVVLVAAHLMLHAVSSYDVQTALEAAFRPEGGVLHDRFVALALRLYDILTDHLRTQLPVALAHLPNGRITSLPALVDEVLSLIYTHRQFHVLRAEVSTLLLGGEAQVTAVGDLFRVFVAQSRELRQTRQHAAATAQTLQRARERGLLATKWSRRWLLEPSSIHVASAPQAAESPSLGQFARWLYDLACIDLALHRDGDASIQVLGVRSALPVLSGAFTYTELVLDGSLRAFSLTPSGIASTIPTCEGWYVGDYAANVSDRPNEIEVEIYAFVERDLRWNAASLRKWTDPEFVGVITVRRIHVRLVLDELTHSPPSAHEPVDRYIVFFGTVAHATHTMVTRSQRRMRKRYADMDTPSRAELLRELRWTPLYEFQGSYVAVPTS